MSFETAICPTILTLLTTTNSNVLYFTPYYSTTYSASTTSISSV